MSKTKKNGKKINPDKLRRKLLPLRSLNRAKIKSLIPNLCTLCVAWAGVIAIRSASEQNIELAMYAVVAACILDMLDGRLARNLKVASEFGAILDSLADVIAFGVAPALVLYYWGGANGVLVWPACLFFIACCMMRLARFTIGAFLPTDTDIQAHFYFGIPAPIGALIVLLPLANNLFWQAYIEPNSITSSSIEVIHQYIILPTLLVVSLLMISTIPTFSSKNLRFIGRNRIWLWLLAVVIVFGILENLWFTWLLFVLVYLSTIGVTIRRYRGMIKDKDSTTPKGKMVE